MPVNTMKRPEINEAARRSRRNFDLLHRRIIESAQEAHIAKETRTNAEARVGELETNLPYAASASPTYRTFVLLTPLLMLGVGFGEWVISVPTAEWLTVKVMGQPAWLPFTRVFLPMGLIIADVLAAYGLYLSRSENDLLERRDPRAILAPCLIVTVVLLSAATQLAVRPAEGASGNLVWSFWTKAVGLVMLTGVLHSLIILNGRAISESISYWVYITRRGSARNAAARAGADFERFSQRSMQEFSRYLQERGEHIRLWGQIEPHPFDERTRAILRERLGYDPFSAPPEPPTQDFSTSAPTESSPAGNEGRDDEYYRKLLEERIRDEEKEIKE